MGFMKEIQELLSSMLRFSHSSFEIYPNIFEPCHRSHVPNNKDNSKQWHAPKELPLGIHSRRSVSAETPCFCNAKAYFFAGFSNTFFEAMCVAILSMMLPNLY